eukprot:scaffold938_cov334-Pavlova_lutheri.AAC.35
MQAAGPHRSHGEGKPSTPSKVLTPVADCANRARSKHEQRISRGRKCKQTSCKWLSLTSNRLLARHRMFQETC